MKARKPHCASASCLPEAFEASKRQPQAASKLYLSDPNSISQFFTSHTTLPIKLSVSHFFNCPQAAELNLILFQSKERPNGAVPKPGKSIEQAAKKINLDLNHIGLGGDVNQGVR